MVVVVGSSVVVVGRRVVVVVGRTVVGPAVGRARGLGRVVVGAAASLAGASSRASPGGPGAVANPSTLPPTAPSTTATTSVAHRRSSLNRIHAPACESGFQ